MTLARQSPLKPVADPPAPTHRVLVVDPHTLVREWVVSRLPADEFEVVAQVSTGEDAILEAERLRPDAVLLDLKLPDLPGETVCAAIVARVPEAAVLILSACGDDDSITSALHAGARAYLLKDADHFDLPNAIRRVLNDESVLDPRAAAVLLRSFGANRPAPPILTKQELRVLRLAAQGLTNPQIGAQLFLSRHTVKEYLSSAMRKLGVGSRTEAVIEVSRRGLLDLGRAADA